MSINLDKEFLKFFETELKNPKFSKKEAKIEFYTLARGSTKEAGGELFKLLKKYRPSAARTIKKEAKKLELW
ncbi:MAG: hypothetical protein Q7K28_00050 [Candidatus Wildermuthbacteria bacterium]|nr:hypothetical protein [Candidatus Wildermuthbacteria bacterium]